MFGSVRKKQLLLFLFDVAIIAGACLSAGFLRFGMDGGASYLRENILPFALTGIVFLTLFYIADLYDFKKNFHSPQQIAITALACFIAFAVSSFLIYWFWLWLPGRGVFVLYWAIVGAGVVLWRSVFSSLAKHPAFRIKAVIIGGGEPQRMLAEKIAHDKNIDVNLAGFIGGASSSREAPLRTQFIGEVGDLEKVIADFQINTVIVEDKYRVDDAVKNVLGRCFINGIRITDIPTFYSDYWHRIPLLWTSKEWLYQELTKERPLIPYYQNLERVTDIILSGIALVLFFPVFIAISMAIKLFSSGPVFYLQKRLGKEMKRICVIKFRTMVKDAEKKSGMIWAKENDSRITPLGGLLRKTRLDELPQLINVLKGEMSIVGPRPERSKFVAQFLEENGVYQKKTKNGDSVSEIPYYSLRLLVKPGITGWAQVNYGYADSHESSKRKLEYDLYYVINRSFFLDFGILLKTIKVMFAGKGK